MIHMNRELPSAIPEIRVKSVARAAVYYEKRLGFTWDWGVEAIGQVSRGNCRIFLTDDEFRGEQGAWTPASIWLNLDSRTEVDEVYQEWTSRGAEVLARPDSKPWNLYEFSAADLDGNLLRVFYDFAWELPDRGGRKDDAAERENARANDT